MLDMRGIIVIHVCIKTVISCSLFCFQTTVMRCGGDRNTGIIKY